MIIFLFCLFILLFCSAYVVQIIILFFIVLFNLSNRVRLKISQSLFTPKYLNRNNLYPKCLKKKKKKKVQPSKREWPSHFPNLPFKKE